MDEKKATPSRIPRQSQPQMQKKNAEKKTISENAKTVRELKTHFTKKNWIKNATNVFRIEINYYALPTHGNHQSSKSHYTKRLWNEINSNNTAINYNIQVHAALKFIIRPCFLDDTAWNIKGRTEESLIFHVDVVGIAKMEEYEPMWRPLTIKSQATTWQTWNSCNGACAVDCWVSFFFAAVTLLVQHQNAQN